MDRATGFYPVGWGFESLRAHICEGIGVIARAGIRLTTVLTAVLPWSGFASASPGDSAVLADPQAAWNIWTMPQRRAAVSALFESITVTHLKCGNPIATSVHRWTAIRHLSGSACSQS